VTGSSEATYELASFKDFIDDKLDHRHVDNVIDGPCMAENLARYLYELASGVWPEVVAARVGESPKIWVEYWTDP
jgi:6-pyruvoyltetrahydropterin/6-carboxytetrahydropterin synthase